MPRGRPRTYSYRDLAELLRTTSMSYAQIAQKLGVKACTISKAVLRMKKKSWLDLAASENRPGGHGGTVAKALTIMGREGFSALQRLDAQAQIIEEENKFILGQMQALNPDTAETEKQTDCPSCKHRFPVMVSNRDDVMQQRMKLHDRLVKGAAEVRQQLEVIKGVLKEAVTVAEVDDFKRIVIEEISCESAETQRRILERIKQRGIAGELSRLGKPGA